MWSASPALPGAPSLGTTPTGRADLAGCTGGKPLLRWWQHWLWAAMPISLVCDKEIGVFLVRQKEKKF